MGSDRSATVGKAGRPEGPPRSLQQQSGGQEPAGQHGSMTSIVPPLIDGGRYVDGDIDRCQYDGMREIAVIDAACCPQVLAAPLDEDEAERLAAALRVLADPARLQLLSLIGSHPNGEACVCDLTAPLGLTQPTVSHHLKVLTDAGLVGREQRGRWVYYWLLPEPIALLRSALAEPPVGREAVQA